MLKNNEPYRYAQPQPTQTKLARLRIKVTGKKRVGGNPKGSPRSKNYGTGIGTREVPSLPRVCCQEGLPEPAPTNALKPGEQRMLKETGALRFAEKIQHPQRVVRAQSKKAQAIHSQQA